MKVVVISATSTFAVIAVISMIFYKSILMSFGIATLSIAAHNGLKQSRIIAESMKSRHASKKTKASKRFFKNTGKRLAATALAGTSVGVPVAIFAVAMIDANSYCDEKKEFLEDGNILNGTSLSFDSKQCLFEAKQDAEVIIADVNQDITNGIESSKKYGSETWSTLKDYGASSFGSLRQATTNLVESVKDRHKE